MAQHLIALYTRDLQKLLTELEAYQNEAHLWQTLPGTSNSAGNLTLHLIGNLNTYIGKNLAHSGYVRDRPAEFASKNIARSWMVDEIKKLIALIENTLQSLSQEQLQAPHPEQVLGYPMSNEYFLIHLLAHFSYHLGQINYHRRVVEAVD